MATVEAKALPPFMPKRSSFEDSCDNLSLVSSLTMDSLRFDDDDDQSQESISILLPSCFGFSSDASSEGARRMENLRDVLGSVLDQLGDDDF